MAWVWVCGRYLQETFGKNTGKFTYTHRFSAPKIIYRWRG